MHIKYQKKLKHIHKQLKEKHINYDKLGRCIMQVQFKFETYMLKESECDTEWVEEERKKEYEC